MNQRELEKAIAAEVENWPDATVEFVAGGKHPKAKLKFGGLLLALPFPGTPGSVRSIHNTLGDVRKALRKLGAVRSKPDPSKDEDEAVYHKPNDGAAKRGSAVAAEPVEGKATVAEQLVEVGLAKAPIAATTDDLVATSGTAKFAAVAGGVCDLETGEWIDEPDEAAAKRAAVRAEAEAIVDGVYFGLSDEVYHSVARLSGSGLQNLAVSPATFWARSWLNPEKAEAELDEDSTVAQTLGKAYHCARLEPDDFHARFVRKPEKADFPAKSLLTSDAAIKAALKDLGEPQTSGSTETIPERGRRLLDAGYRGTVLAVVLDDYEAERAGRTPIPGVLFDQIIVDMDRIRDSGEIAAILSGGFAEVSIFWTDKHGLKMKARLDYLKVDEWVDLKTFVNAQGKALGQAIADFVRYNRVYVQAATYRDATEAVRIGGLDVVGPATEAQKSLVYDLRTRAKPLKCWYVFTEKGGVPNLLAREFRFHAVSAYKETEIKALVETGRQDTVREALGGVTGLYSRAIWEIDKAKRDFVLYSQVYDPGKPWFPIDAVGHFDDLDFNSYWLEGKA